MSNTTLIQCPNCAALQEQELLDSGERKCGYCGAKYTFSPKTAIRGAVTTVKRAVSKKEEDADFGWASLILSLLAIMAAWAFATAFLGTFIMVFGSFCAMAVMGKFLSPLIAYGLAAVIWLFVGILMIIAEGEETDSENK